MTIPCFADLPVSSSVENIYLTEEDPYVYHCGSSHEAIPGCPMLSSGSSDRYVLHAVIAVACCTVIIPYPSNFCGARCGVWVRYSDSCWLMLFIALKCSSLLSCWHSADHSLGCIRQLPLCRAGVRKMTRPRKFFFYSLSLGTTC
jgi:hypothetical protein